MATRPPRSPLIAVDTNVPLDLADRKEHVLDALDAVRRRLNPGRVLVTPTVFQELVFLADDSEAESDRDQAGWLAHRGPPSLRVTPLTGEKYQAGRTF